MKCIPVVRFRKRRFTIIAYILTGKHWKKLRQHWKCNCHPIFLLVRHLQHHPHLSNRLKALFTSFQQPFNDSLKEEEDFIVFMHGLFSSSDCRPLHQYSNEDSRIRTLIDFINSNYKKPLSLQNFSDVVHLNPFHLGRIFKKSTGLSPYDYLMTTRIEFAKSLLKKGWLVQDAAMDAGFYDTSHFYRLFKRASGITPKAIPFL